MACSLLSPRGSVACRDSQVADRSLDTSDSWCAPGSLNTSSKIFEAGSLCQCLDIERLKLNLLKTPNTFFKKAFNPVCFWFVNYNDKTIGVIAEVTNTFKEQHSYYLSNNGNPITQELWLEDSKKLYVSPFADKIGRYKFNFSQEPLIVKINEYDPQENLEIITSLQGESTQASGFMKFLMYISIMYNSFNVIPRIHIQAFYLWIKKFKFYSHNGNGHV